MSSLTKSITKNGLSLKAQTFAAIAAIVGAVAVPQLFHVLGAVSGLGTKLGETFLPMHLPIILVGLLAGPFAGAVSGLLGPLCSFAISGMPSAVMLPFMMIELCAYGLFAGLLNKSKMPVVIKVLLVQIAGRAVRAAFILLAVYGFKHEGVKLAVIWMSIPAGLFGICLQWCLIPLVVFRVQNFKK